MSYFVVQHFDLNRSLSDGGSVSLFESDSEAVDYVVDQFNEWESHETDFCNTDCQFALLGSLDSVKRVVLSNLAEKGETTYPLPTSCMSDSLNQFHITKCDLIRAKQ